MITAGMPAPDFELADDTGALCKLSDFRGKPVVLYFYPEDDTPGCTKEACNFRDDYSEYGKAGVVILGVSPDSVESHVKFKLKYQIPFALLADPGHRVCDLYGVWGPKKFVGRDYEGVLRTTFLIGPDGRVLRVFEQVRPSIATRYWPPCRAARERSIRLATIPMLVGRACNSQRLGSPDLIQRFSCAQK
jgi:peroxiredoxin Q/BCP